MKILKTASYNKAMKKQSQFYNTDDLDAGAWESTPGWGDTSVDLGIEDLGDDDLGIDEDFDTEAKNEMKDQFRRDLQTAFRNNEDTGGIVTDFINDFKTTFGDITDDEMSEINSIWMSEKEKSSVSPGMEDIDINPFEEI